MKLKGIRRVNKFTDPELLGEDEVTRLENLILDGGIAKKRGGIQSYNTASTGGTIKGIYELNGYIYGLIDVGSTYTLKKLSGTWSNIKTGLSQAPLHFLRFNDRGVFTNGADDLFTLDTTTHSFIITSPDLSEVTATASTGGSMDDTAWYGYRMTYVMASGEESAFSDIITAQTDATNKSVTFSSLPVSSDTRVTGRRLYRTEGGGDVFYLNTTLDNVVTSYTDSASDTSLDTSESVPYLVEVSTASYMCKHKGRLVLANISANNNVEVVPFRVYVEEKGAGNVSGNLIYGLSFLMFDGTETEIVSTSQATGTISSKELTVTYAPNRNQDTSGVAKVNIYRKNIDTPFDDWYLVTSTSAKFGTYDDNTATLSSTYPAVSSDSYEEAINESRIYYSDIDKPQRIPQLNYIDIYPDDDEEIVGLVDQEEGILVLKEKSICFVYTSGSPYNWRVVKLVENVGCTDSNSIQRAKNAIYFKYQDDIYRYPDMKIVSLEFKDTLDGVSIQGTAYVSKYNWYVIVGSSWFYIYDEKNGTWLHFIPSSGTFYSALETIDGVFLIGSEVLLYYDSSETLDYDDDGGSNDADISSTLRSKTFVTGTPNQGFRLRKIYSNYQTGGSVTQSLTDPDSGDSKSVTRSDSGWVEYRGITDSLTGDLKTSHKLYYQISGDIQQFSGMELEGILRHRRRTWS